MSAPDALPSGKRPHPQGTHETAVTEANGRTKRRHRGDFRRSTSIRRDETVFRILCPASKTGSIIGKAGSIIKSIRKDTGAMIRVEDAVPGCDERVVTISAKADRSKAPKFRGEDGLAKEEEEDRVEYLSDIDEDQEERVDGQEEGEGKEEPSKPAKIDPEVETKEGDLAPAQEALLRVHLRIVESDSAQPEDIDQLEAELKIGTRLLVPTSQVGCLLGKRGKIIEQMRQHTGAQIRVLPKDQLPRCALPTEEVVQITGDLVAVRKALHAASCQLRDNPPKDQGQEFGSGFPIVGGMLQTAEPLSQKPVFMGNMMGAHADVGRILSPQHAFGQLPGPYGPEVHFMKEDVTFRILCPKERIGSIIGKGGSIIQRLREETGAKIRIDVSASEGEERVVRISAMETSEDSFSKAQKAILIVQSKIFDFGVDKDIGPVTTKLLVPSDQAGCLIGKGGSIIAEMRKLTHAKIRIYGKEHLPPCALENDELVQIIGNANVSQDALLQITARLRSNLLHGKFGPGPMVVPASVPQGEVPLPLGMGMMPGAPPFGRYHSPFPEVPIGVKGQHPPVPPPPGPWPPQDVGGKNYTEFRAHQQLETAGDMARSNASLATSTTVEVVVPERVMGSIIGENGRNLAQIREISGAKVKVHLLSPGASERIIEISGTPDKTHAAQSLVQAFILSGQ